MLDQILPDLEAHCERLVTRLDEIGTMHVALSAEKTRLRAELKTAQALCTATKRILDLSVRKTQVRKSTLRAVS